MKRLLISITTACSLGLSGAALAQQPPAPSSPAPKVENVPSPTPTIIPPSTVPGAAPVLTDDQANDWIDKAVYSTDGTKLGDVAKFVRDASGRVIELQADIGGFLGFGETRVRVMPVDFRLEKDRVVLNLTAAAAKSLPPIPKN